MHLGLAVGIAAAMLLPVAARAQAIKLTGAIEHPRTISLAELKAMPPTTVTLTQTAGSRTTPSTFTGTLLLPLVKAAGLVDAPGKSGPLQHVLLPHGSDGYAVAVAIGELDPEFEGKQVLIAWERDGKPLPSPQLVVPGDKRAGRSVHEVVEIEVR